MASAASALEVLLDSMAEDYPGKKKHDTDKWKWVDLDKDNGPQTKAGHWELKGTPKPYNRSEYAMAKIESPDRP